MKRNLKQIVMLCVAAMMMLAFAVTANAAELRIYANPDPEYDQKSFMTVKGYNINIDANDTITITKKGKVKASDRYAYAALSYGNKLYYSVGLQRKAGEDESHAGKYAIKVFDYKKGKAKKLATFTANDDRDMTSFYIRGKYMIVSTSGNKVSCRLMTIKLSNGKKAKLNKGNAIWNLGEIYKNRIYYYGYDNKTGWGVYKSNMDGSHRKRLVKKVNMGFFLGLKVKGNRVYYVDGTQFYSVSVNGGKVKPVTNEFKLNRYYYEDGDYEEDLADPEGFDAASNQYTRPCTYLTFGERVTAE